MAGFDTLWALNLPLDLRSIFRLKRISAASEPSVLPLGPSEPVLLFGDSDPGFTSEAASPPLCCCRRFNLLLSFAASPPTSRQRTHCEADGSKRRDEMSILTYEIFAGRRGNVGSFPCCSKLPALLRARVVQYCTRLYSSHCLAIPSCLVYCCPVPFRDPVSKNRRIAIGDWSSLSGFKFAPHRCRGSRPRRIWTTVSGTKTTTMMTNRRSLTCLLTT